MAKKSKNEERKAKIEQLRREQQRKERRRSMAILGACGVVVVALLGAALIPYIKRLARGRQAQEHRADQARRLRGVRGLLADQDRRPLREAGSTSRRRPRSITTTAPPAFGKHWGNFLTGSEIRHVLHRRRTVPRSSGSCTASSTGTRSSGTTTRSTRAAATTRRSDQIATKLGTDSYVMVAPWTKKDGASFPSGKHIAFTHWTGPQTAAGHLGVLQQGQWAGRRRRSPTTYPKENSPEPGAA